MPYPKILLTILPPFWPKMPPLGLGYLESFLAKNDISSEILDLNNLFYNLVSDKLKKEWLISCNISLEDGILSLMKDKYFKEYDLAIEKLLNYDVIGFSCFKSNIKSTLEIANLLRSKKRDIKLVLGGPEIARLFFKSNGKFSEDINQLADFLVVGEGEKPFLNYIKGKNTQRISEFEQLDSLADLPYPKYNSLNLSDYSNNKAVNLLFSRGCIRRCNFCSERLIYKGFRMRPVENIIEEIRYHRLNNNSNYFIFFDSLINADYDKLDKLCDGIIDNFGFINWEAQLAIRSDMDESILKKMKKSGCYNLFVGLESGSDATLKRMNKGFTVRQAEEFFKRLKNAGLFFGISIIVGYPGESKTDFQESLDFVIKNKGIIPKIEQINPFTYYDGTPADKNSDYKSNSDSLERMDIFVNQIKQRGFKYTNAFLGNLIEKC